MSASNRTFWTSTPRSSNKSASICSRSSSKAVRHQEAGNRTTVRSTSGALDARTRPRRNDFPKPFYNFPFHSISKHSVSNYETILYSVDDNRATIMLNRPVNLNGITNKMMWELYECVIAIALDEHVLGVRLTGAGRGFCPGADLKAYSSGEHQEPNRREYFNITSLLHDMSKVTVVVISGACAGVGFGWVCACGLRYATSRAVFNSAFLGIAISGDMAGPCLLPRILGATKARELFFLPGRFDAHEAERLGLVSKTFPDETFRDDVEAIVNRLAKSAQLAIGIMKRNFINANNMPLRDYIELETERHRRDCG